MEGNAGFGGGFEAAFCGGDAKSVEAAKRDRWVSEFEVRERRRVSEANGLPEVVGGHGSEP